MPSKPATIPPQKYAPKPEPLTKLLYLLLRRLCGDQEEIVVPRERLFDHIRAWSFISNPASTVNHLRRHGVVKECRDGSVRVRRPVRDVNRLPGAMPHNWLDILHGSQPPSP